MATSAGNPKLDRLDLRILCHLQKNGRASNVEIADAVGLPPRPCRARGERPQPRPRRAIAGYGAPTRLDRRGATLLVFTEVTLQDHKRDDFVKFETSIGPIDEI